MTLLGELLDDLYVEYVDGELAENDEMRERGVFASTQHVKSLVESLGESDRRALQAAERQRDRGFVAMFSAKEEMAVYRCLRRATVEVFPRTADL